MFDMASFLNGIKMIATPYGILLMFLGTTVGAIFGAIPG
jgi:TctA family transporter